MEEGVRGAAWSCISNAPPAVSSTSAAELGQRVASPMIMINHHLPKPQPSPSSPPYSPANPHKNYRLLIYNHRLYGDASLPFAGSHDAAALKPMGSLQARGGPPRKRSPAIGHRRSTGRGSSGNPKSRLDGRRRSAANGDAGMGKDRLGELPARVAASQAEVGLGQDAEL
jgi:hypothetical protein